MNIDIQLASKDDVDCIVDIENVLFDNAFGWGTIRRELDASRVYVAKDGMDVPVGYAIVRVSPPLSDLLRLGVMPTFQGKGIGSALLDHVLAMTPGPMMLMVLKTNSPAIKLYRRRGFEIVGTSSSSWLMKRVTSASA